MITRESDDAGARFLVLKDRPGKTAPVELLTALRAAAVADREWKEVREQLTDLRLEVGRYKALLEEALPARKGSSGPMERSPELAGEFTAPADRKLVRTTEEEAAKKRSKNLKQVEKLEGDPAYLQAKVAILGQELIELETRDEKHSRDREAELDAASALLGKKEAKSGWTSRCRRRGGWRRASKRSAPPSTRTALAHQLIAVGEADGDSGACQFHCRRCSTTRRPTSRAARRACRARSARPSATRAARERAAEVSARA